MGSRRQGREKALQVLFELGFHENPAPEEVDRRIAAFVDHFGSPTASVDFMRWLVKGVQWEIGEIDRLIEEAATNWRVDRMNRIDRSIIRLAVFEIMKEETTPVRVVINEAIELAKTFSCQESSRFINGILDNIGHRLRPRELTVAEQQNVPALEELDDGVVEESFTEMAESLESNQPASGAAIQ